MPPLGALLRPHYRMGCITGLWRFGEEWIALSEGPDSAYLDASGRHAEQALRRLSDRLRERRGPATG